MMTKRSFTMLELLLVVSILSAVAFMALSTAGNSMNQVRFENTRNRLGFIREAIVGDYDYKQGLLSGFVVDNGRLPESLRELLQSEYDPDEDMNGEEGEFSYREYSLLEPVFNNPDPNTEGELGEHVFNKNEYRIFKGHRGSYLAGATRQEYRDGWGNKNVNEEEDDLQNFGWRIDSSTNNEFEVTSLGLDGEDNVTSEMGSVAASYEEDFSERLKENDWTQPVGLSVRIKNSTGFDLRLEDNSPEPEQRFRAVLLVYENSPSGVGAWRRVESQSTEELKDNNGAPEPLQGLDGNGDGQVNGKYSPSFIDLVFDEIIPVGEHLLVLYLDEDNDAGTLDDKVDLQEYLDAQAEKSEYPSASDPKEFPSPYFIAKRIKFYPRSTAPTMELEIR